jgi:hypothetical protein
MFFTPATWLVLFFLLIITNSSAAEWNVLWCEMTITWDAGKSKPKFFATMDYNREGWGGG